MKKFFTFAVALALAASMTVLFSSCGEKGETGADGKTPYIGENGNWWIG